MPCPLPSLRCVHVRAFPVGLQASLWHSVRFLSRKLHHNLDSHTIFCKGDRVAKFAADNIKKGHQVYVAGRLVFHKVCSSGLRLCTTHPPLTAFLHLQKKAFMWSTDTGW